MNVSVVRPNPRPLCPLPKRRCVLVCQDRSCQRNGSEDVLVAFRNAPAAGVLVSEGGCTGQCSSGPTVRVVPDGTWYCRVRPGDVAEIVHQHFEGDRPVGRLLHTRFHPRFDAYR